MTEVPTGSCSVTLFCIDKWNIACHVSEKKKGMSLFTIAVIADGKLVSSEETKEEKNSCRVATGWMASSIQWT